jgi:hypothetical protein
VVTPVRCPIIADPDAGLAPPADFDPLIARLRATATRPPDTGPTMPDFSDVPGGPVTETFPRGIMRDDGRLDLCKQGVGPVQAARIVAAAAGSPLVRHLLLGTNGLGTEGSRAVAGALRPGHGIETLYLGCNKIGPAGTEALAERLAEDDTVRALWLKRNPLGDEGVARLAAALARNRAVRTLDLVNVGMSAAGLTVLAETLAAGGPRLQRLYLGGNGFGPEALPALRILIHDAGVRELYLAANHLGDEGASALAAAADGVPMILGLGGNGLTATGVAALARHCGQWTALDLARPPSERALGANGNLVGDDGAAALAAALPRARLRRLDLRRTGIGGRGAGLLVAAIADGHPTMEYLGLSGGVPRRLRRQVSGLLGDRRGAGAHADVRAITSVYR